MPVTEGDDIGPTARREVPAAPDGCTSTLQRYYGDRRHGRSQWKLV